MKSCTNLIIIEDIIRYLEFLKGKGYTLSLCKLDQIFHICYDNLLLYIGHNLEYCLRIKEHKKNLCLEHQDKLIETASVNDCGPFRCFAGVSEYVFPIEQDGKRYGIICLTGYRGGESGENKSYIELKKDIPDKKTAKAIVMPLLYMFENLISQIKNMQKEPEEYSVPQKTYYKILNFIANNIGRPITLKDLCDYTHYSQSYVSREFKKINGKSVIDYVLDYKIKTAKRFLEQTELSISDISFKVGYYNPNDFTNIFKKKVGLSPRAYRANLKTNA